MILEYYRLFGHELQGGKRNNKKKDIHLDVLLFSARGGTAASSQEKTAAARIAALRGTCRRALRAITARYYLLIYKSSDLNVV